METKKQKTQKKTVQKKQSNNLDITKFRLLHDYVLIKSIREEKVNGLYKSEQYDDKPEFGIVISVGDGKLLENGTIVPTSLKKGDTVFFGKYSTEQTRNLGQDYFLIRAEDVRAVL